MFHITPQDGAESHLQYCENFIKLKVTMIFLFLNELLINSLFRLKTWFNTPFQ